VKITGENTSNGRRGTDITQQEEETQVDHVKMDDARKGRTDRRAACTRTDNSPYCVHYCQVQVYTAARRPSEQLGS
jgi:hypothetical protein